MNRNVFFSALASVLVASAASFLTVNTVHAQGAQLLEEIVVTATLTEQSELDTPISIDILTGETMTKNNIMTIKII